MYLYARSIVILMQAQRECPSLKEIDKDTTL